MKKILFLLSSLQSCIWAKKLRQENNTASFFFSQGNFITQNLGENIASTTIATFIASTDLDLIFIDKTYCSQPIFDLIAQRKIPVWGIVPQELEQLTHSRIQLYEFAKKNAINILDKKPFRYYVDAEPYLKTANFPLIFKTDSPQLNRQDTFYCEDSQSALLQLKKIMLDPQFGGIEQAVIIEQAVAFLPLTIATLYDGEKLLFLSSCQNYLQSGENNTGYKTDGMATIAPANVILPNLKSDFEQNILLPTQKILNQIASNTPFLLFFDLQIMDNQLFLDQYRFNPYHTELQTLFSLMDNVSCLLLPDSSKTFNITHHAVSLALVSGGYPKQFDTAYSIKGITNILDETLNFSAVKWHDNNLITDGGWVMSISSKASSLESALEMVYNQASKIHFDYKYYRKDFTS